MRKAGFARLFVCAVLSVGTSCSGTKNDDKVAALKQQNAALADKVARLEKEALQASVKSPPLATLPKSLDALYPPRAQTPVYTARMTAMALPGEAMLEQLTQGDHKNALASFEKFVGQYKEVRDLVPEWADSFPMGPIDELRKALASGDMGKVMPVVDKVTEICRDCHVERMTAVQQVYYWKDTRAFKVDDPVSRQKVSYAEFMHSLGGSLAAIGAEFGQGNKDAAEKQLAAFEKRFEKLEDTCSYCHGTPREYFVDKSVKKMIADFGKELGKADPDPAYLDRLGKQIGNDSCFKCHLVHMPAALTKARLSR